MELLYNLYNPAMTAANPQITAPLQPLAPQLITKSLKRQLLMFALHHRIQTVFSCSVRLKEADTESIAGMKTVLKIQPLKMRGIFDEK